MCNSILSSQQEREKKVFVFFFYFVGFTLNNISCYEYPWKRVRQLHTHTNRPYTHIPKSAHIRSGRHGERVVETQCDYVPDSDIVWQRTHAMNETIFTFTNTLTLELVLYVCACVCSVALLLRWKFTADVELYAFWMPSSRVDEYGSFFTSSIAQLKSVSQSYFERTVGHCQSSLLRRDQFVVSQFALNICCAFPSLVATCICKLE